MPARTNVILLIMSLSAHLAVEANTNDESKPPIELLEFLGQWTDEEGDEIDFDMLEEPGFPEIRDEQNYDRFRR